MNFEIEKSYILYKKALKPSKPLHLIWVRPGTFKMGSTQVTKATEVLEPQFTVKLSQGFWLSKYLVTQAQWQLVMGTEQTETEELYAQRGFYFEKNPDYPITMVDWQDAINFCNKLNQIWSAKIPMGYTFSLPTSAQWEYACRAGSESLYHSGSTIEDLSRVAWHADNSYGSMHPVGQKEPNSWGFYDMHGTVFEWVYDAYSGSPSDNYVIDWVGEGDGLVRLLRSGFLGYSPESEYFWCASHQPVAWYDSTHGIGFRVCLRPIIES